MMSLRTTVHRGSHADARTPTRRSTRRSTRRGMLLPLVLVTMLLVFTIAASLNQVAWRATKGAQALWDAQRAMYAADAEVVRAIAYWSPDSVAATPIGTPLVRDTNLLGGFQARTTTMRTGPLRAVIMSVARRDRPSGPTDVDPSRVKRLVARAVPLIPPEFPLVGAATVLGPIALGSTALDGRDVPGPYNATRDDCGPQRDTNSIAALAAQSMAILGAASVRGPALITPPTQLAIARAQFDSGFTQLRTRVASVPMASGNAVPRYPAWRAIVIRDTSGVTLRGASTHVGLLAVDGDLTLRGTLEVDGVLLVSGALDASQGTLTVRGALIVRDAAVRGSTLGDRVDVRYAPCLVGRALVAVAVPTPGRYSLWNSP